MEYIFFLYLGGFTSMDLLEKLKYVMQSVMVDGSYDFNSLCSMIQIICLQIVYLAHTRFTVAIHTYHTYYIREGKNSYIARYFVRFIGIGITKLCQISIAQGSFTQIYRSIIFWHLFSLSYRALSIYPIDDEFLAYNVVSTDSCRIIDLLSEIFSLYILTRRGQ